MLINEATLREMEFHELREINNFDITVRIIRVINGWIYEIDNKLVFVPENT